MPGEKEIVTGRDGPLQEVVLASPVTNQLPSRWQVWGQESSDSLQGKWSLHYWQTCSSVASGSFRIFCCRGRSLLHLFCAKLFLIWRNKTYLWREGTEFLLLGKADAVAGVVTHQLTVMWQRKFGTLYLIVLWVLPEEKPCHEIIQRKII